jgi:hypothetical protein
MTTPECTPIRGRGPRFRVGRYEISAWSPLRWGVSVPFAGSYLGVGNCRTPVGALLALRRAEREIPAA